MTSLTDHTVIDVGQRSSRAPRAESTTRPRVAFVVYSFGAGGLERCAANLINVLGDEIQPMVISLTSTGTAAEWLQGDVPVIELHKPPKNDLQVVRRLADCLRQHQIDIVHSHNWGTLLETVLACRKLPAIAHVHAQHGLEIESSGVRGIKRTIRTAGFRWGLKRTDAVVAIANCVQQWITDDLRVSRDKVHLLENGISLTGDSSDDPSFSPRRHLGLSDEAEVLGCVCRLAEVKGLPLAIDTLHDLAKQRKDVHLVLVGEGPCRQSLQQQAQRLGIADRVHLVGNQMNVGRWLETFDLLLNTSLSEAMNLAILEAMAASCPIVAVAVGDNRRLVLDRQLPVGRVVDNRDTDEMVSTVSDLLDSREELARYRSNGPVRFRAHFTVERMCERYAQLYRNLVSNS